jgi:hypothetical protein
MKNIIPALNRLQLVCQDRAAPLSDIGDARKQLFAAIEEALVEACNCCGHFSNKDQMSIGAYLIKFSKLNGE